MDEIGKLKHVEILLVEDNLADGRGPQRGKDK